MTSKELNLNEKIDVKVKTTPNSANYKNVLWESDDSNVVSVEKKDDLLSATLHAKKPGKATITVSTRGGYYCGTTVTDSWEITVKIAEGKVYANMDSFWYGSTFNGVNKYECAGYVIGRIGEVHNVRIRFKRLGPSPSLGGGDGGWWIQNANDEAEVWVDGAKEKTNKIRSVIKETDPNKVEAGCAASFQYEVYGANYGHVVYVEDVNIINGVKWVYYSNSFNSESGKLIAGKIFKAPLETLNKGKKDEIIGFLENWPGFQGYIKIK